MEEELEKIYTDPSNPGSFASVRALYQSARNKGLKVSLKRVKEFLTRQDTYTLHKPARRRFRRNRTIVYGIDEQWQADLADFQKLSRYNSGSRYVLCIIDVFSKQAIAVAVKNKKGATILEALRKVLDSGRQVKRIQSDHGNEFVCKEVQRELERRKIGFFATHSEVKASIVERFIKTFKSRLYRYFTQHNTLKYVDVLDDIITAYNNSYHRSIKCKPVEVTPDRTAEIWRNLYGSVNFSPPTSYAFDIGDICRISRNLTIFDKKYKPNFTTELFKISERLPRDPPVYKLVDLNSNVISGVFYREEVQRVGKDLSDCYFSIEKVLKKRKAADGTIELYVKWKDYDPSFNSWIREVDLK